MADVVAYDLFSDLEEVIINLGLLRGFIRFRQSIQIR